MGLFIISVILLLVSIFCCILPAAIAGHLDRRKKEKIVVQEEIINPPQPQPGTIIDEGIDLQFNSIEDLRDVF